MTVPSVFRTVTLCLILSFNPSESTRMRRNPQLMGNPVPYKIVEEKIHEKLSKRCPPGSNTPDIPDVKWEHHNEIRTISSPFSHIPKKTSSLLMEWKRHLNEMAYRNGYSEYNPYINTGGMDLPNVYDHFRLNGASPCRDIDLVIPQKDEFGKSYNRVYRQTDVLEVVNVTKHHRIPLLNGQFALRAKIDIPRNTVIGRFCGDEMYSFEHDKVYKGTCEMRMRDDYRAGMECPFNDFNKVELCPIQGNEGMDVFISLDELTTFPANPMIFANDPRRDLSKAELTNQDFEFLNADHININVNGWPYMIIMNFKSIRKGEEITFYYGEKYVRTPQQMNL